MKIKVKYGRGCREWMVYELAKESQGTYIVRLQFFPTWQEAISEADRRAGMALLHGIMQGGWI